MPYVKQINRDHHEPFTRQIKELHFLGPGDLNYIVTLLAHRYVDMYGGDYQAYNDAIGALEAAKLELYRRKVVPYEDKKIAENGDV